MVGRIRFALERLDSPRRSSHVAQLWSLGHIHTMSFKIRPTSNQILAPFAVFFIVLGVVAIGIQVYRVFYSLDDLQRHSAFCVTLLAASVAAVIYSIIALRNRLAMSWLDRVLYFFIPLIFATVGCLTFYIWR